MEKHNITKIKYFTALVKGTLKGSLNIIRQHMYLRALKTLPNLEIIFGQFKKRQISSLCQALFFRPLSQFFNSKFRYINSLASHKIVLLESV